MTVEGRTAGKDQVAEERKGARLAKNRLGTILV